MVLIGFRLPTLIGGSVVIETIFQWPGIGNAFKTAVTGQNYPLVMMIALFSVLAVLMASFLVDILTAVLDPRVKLEYVNFPVTLSAIDFLFSDKCSHFASPSFCG